MTLVIAVLFLFVVAVFENGRTNGTTRLLAAGRIDPQVSTIPLVLKLMRTAVLALLDAHFAFLFVVIESFGSITVRRIS